LRQKFKPKQHKKKFTGSFFVKKTIKATLVILAIAVVLVTGIFYFASQLRGSTERFGIYLSKNIELVISDEDIVWYDKDSYAIKLTDEGIEKIQTLKVESVTYGEPFVVKIGNQEIYDGSFWTPISSVSYGGIVIETLVNMTDNTIKLEKGYPSSDYFEGIDHRNDPRILDHFQKLGKLKQTFKMEIDYSPGIDASALVQFQNEWYTRGSVMHLIDNPSQQSIQLRKGDSVVLRLLDNPLNATQEGYYYLSYNYVFLNGGGGLGDVACAQISLVDPSRFVVPEDGYYVFELGVVNVDCYFPGGSTGVWTFSVTVVPS
jgi:hypothetical protein